MTSKGKNKFKREVFCLLAELSNDVDGDMIEARFIHSVRVANIAEEIAIKGNYSKEIVDSVWTAGMYHDICKLGSNNHAEAAYRYLMKNETLVSTEFVKHVKELICNAIRYHSFKEYHVDLDIVGNILRDADMIDKTSYDSICKTVIGCKSLTARLEKLYEKRSVLVKYDCYDKHSIDMYEKAIERLDSFIGELEACRI